MNLSKKNVFSESFLIRLYNQSRLYSLDFISAVSELLRCLLTGDRQPDGLWWTLAVELKSIQTLIGGNNNIFCFLSLSYFSVTNLTNLRLHLGQIAQTSNSEVCIAGAEGRDGRAGEASTVSLPETEQRTPHHHPRHPSTWTSWVWAGSSSPGSPSSRCGWAPASSYPGTTELMAREILKYFCFLKWNIFKQANSV